MNEAVRRAPTYSLFKNEQFPQASKNGVNVKTKLGEGSPFLELVTDARMFDVEIQSGASYVHRLLPNWTLAGLAIRGDGGSFWTSEASDFPN